jgi:hypothetical protein
MKKFTLIILLLLYTLISIAQKGILKGTITDSKTGESLVGTTILVQGLPPERLRILMAIIFFPTYSPDPITLLFHLFPTNLS